MYIFAFMYVCVLYVCLYCPWRSEEVRNPLGIGIVNDCKPACEC